MTNDYTNLIRIDHTFSAQDQLSGRYILYRGTEAGGSLPTTGGDTDEPSQQMRN